MTAWAYRHEDGRLRGYISTDGREYPCDANGWIDIAHEPADDPGWPGLSERLMMIDEGDEMLIARLHASSIDAISDDGIIVAVVAWRPLPPGRAEVSS